MTSIDPGRFRQGRGCRATGLLILFLLGASCGARAPRAVELPPGVAAAERHQEPSPADTIESRDEALARALERAARSNTCEALLEVAERYHAVGVLDQAAGYYVRATRAAPRCAAAHDGLARVWRDAGYAHLALSSSHRATHFDSRSPEAWNTLGTILQDLGRPAEARAAYERAVACDGASAYAHSNLCYLAFLEGDAERAERSCLAAVAADAAFVPARNNLALLYAAQGDSARALALFEETGGSAAAQYNLGLVLLARRDLPAALAAFEAAYRADPALDAAHARARDVRRLIESERKHGDSRGPAR